MCVYIYICMCEGCFDKYIRASPTDSPNFCTVWRMNNDFYLLVTHFFKYTF